MLRLVPPILVALVEALAAIGTARLILRLARRRPEAASWLDRSLSAHLLVGLPLYGTLLFLAGLISTSTITVYSITIPLALYAIVDSIPRRQEIRDPLPPVRTRDLCGALALAASGVIAFLCAQLPAFSLDELSYHLAVPMQWIIAGRVEAFPLISHSWFPFGLESADLFALRLLGHDGAVASHFVRLFCGMALTSLLVRRLAAESATPLLFTAAIITTPALLIPMGWAWNDVALIGIVVVLYLSLEAFVHAKHALALAGLAVSAGLLTKYTFAPIALLLLGAAFTMADRATRGSLARAVAISGVAGSIFFVRNALLTANPFEPMIAEETGVVGYRWTGSLLETIGAYVFDRRILDEALGASLLILAFFSITRARSRFSLWSCLALLAAWAFIALLTPSARVFLPFLALPALVGGQIVGHFSVAPRRAVTIVIGVAVAAQLALSARYLSVHEPLSLLSGRVSVPNWLIANRPITSDVLWINARLPANSRALILGIQELFWFDGEVRGGGNNDGPRIAAYLRAGDPQQLRDRLRRDGITHVALDRGLVTAPSADFKRRERETVLDESTMNTLGVLLQNERLIATKGPIFVFELR